MSDILLSETHGRVLRLVMNRPESTMPSAPPYAAKWSMPSTTPIATPMVGAIVLTGNGHSFSAGMDLKELGTGLPGNHQ